MTEAEIITINNWLDKTDHPNASWEAREFVQAVRKLMRLCKRGEREAFKAGFDCSAEGWNGEYCENYDKLPGQIEEQYQAFHESYYGNKTKDKN